MKFLRVIDYQNYYLSVALLFVLFSWFLIFFWGLKPGIDLSGGAEWQISFDREMESEFLKRVISESGLKEFILQEVGKNSFLIKSRFMDSLNHKNYFDYLKDKLGDFKEESFASIGPSVSKELARKSILAVILVILGISFYIAYAFRKVSKPVSSWKYGFVTLITLIHDVSITLGFLALIGHFKNYYIDTNSIVAILVVMGFSVHDTIVVFDRIRENVMVNAGKKISFREIINLSVKETFTRSVNTSLTLILVLLSLIFWGPQPLFYFVLTMLVGTFFGTYSSIFVASPLLYFKYKE